MTKVIHPCPHIYDGGQYGNPEISDVALPQPGANPTLDRRLRLIGRLEEQKRLVADPNYKRTIQTSVKKDGVKTVVETQHRVTPWWRMTGNGAFVFFVRASQKLVEFDKGKSAIAVPSLDKIPSVIDTLIAAVRDGELDEQLAQASKAAMARRSRRAA